MKTLPEMFTAVAKQNATRTAVVDGDISVSYADLETRTLVQASELRKLGVRQGDRVALMLSNSLNFVTSYLAILTLGAIVVPLNDHYQQNELLYFLEGCGVSFIVTAQEYAPLCRQVLGQYAAPCEMYLVENLADTLATEPLPPDDLRVTIDPAKPVMYQFSSGSTGTPKRIARTHTNLLFELNSLVRTLQLSNEDRFLGAAPFSHVNGLTRSMLSSVRAGASLYTLAPYQRQAAAELIDKNNITVFIAVPFMFIMLARGRLRSQPDFSSLRLCVSASAHMPPNLNRQFYEKFGIFVRQLYGSTETGTISVNLRSDIKNSLATVGRPIEGVEVEVFAEDGQVALQGEMGEFAVKSPAAITGYHDLPDVNKEVFRDSYFLTGDLGTRDADGLLTLVGRKKFFINKGGYKIAPREIEELLETHPKVAEAVVLGQPTSFGDESVMAIIVATAACTPQEIVEFCRGKIADFKIPSLIEFRDSLPKSPTGKIRRKMLT